MYVSIFRYIHLSHIFLARKKYPVNPIDVRVVLDALNWRGA